MSVWVEVAETGHIIWGTSNVAKWKYRQIASDPFSLIFLIFTQFFECVTSPSSIAAVTSVVALDVCKCTYNSQFGWKCLYTAGLETLTEADT